jgi:hypothetical protein
MARLTAWASVRVNSSIPDNNPKEGPELDATFLLAALPNQTEVRRVTGLARAISDLLKGAAAAGPAGLVPREHS